MKETRSRPQKKAPLSPGLMPIPTGLSIQAIQEDPEILKERIQKLHYLCAHYDPYDKNVPEKIIQLLLEFNLDPQDHNPFSLTENLLILMDQLTTLSKKLP